MGPSLVIRLLIFPDGLTGCRPRHLECTKCPESLPLSQKLSLVRTRTPQDVSILTYRPLDTKGKNGRRLKLFIVEMYIFYISVTILEVQNDCSYQNVIYCTANVHLLTPSRMICLQSKLRRKDLKISPQFFHLHIGTPKGKC